MADELNNTTGGSAATADAPTQQQETKTPEQTQTQTQTQTQAPAAAPASAPPAATKTADTKADVVYSKNDYEAMSVRQFNAGIMKAMKDAGFEGATEEDFKKNLKAFKEYQDSQKSALQLAQEAAEKARKEAEDFQKEINRYKQSEAVRKAGVDDSFVNYVSFEVAEAAKTSGKDFEAALTDFMASHKDRFKAAEQRTVTVDTGGDKSSEPRKGDISFSFMGVRPKPDKK